MDMLLGLFLLKRDIWRKEAYSLRIAEAIERVDYALFLGMF